MPSARLRPSPPPPSPPSPYPPSAPPNVQYSNSTLIIAIIIPVVLIGLALIGGYFAMKKIQVMAKELIEAEGPQGPAIYLVADFIFKKIDKDKSGTLDPDEIREFMCGPGGMSEQEVEELIKRVDSDGNGEIDLNEWRTAWLGGLSGEIQRLRANEIKEASELSEERKNSVMAFAAKAEEKSTAPAPTLPPAAAEGTKQDV